MTDVGRRTRSAAGHRSGILVATLAVVISGCATTEDQPAASTGCATTADQPRAAALSVRATSPDDAVDHVVAISVDGLLPAAIRRLGRDRAPGFHRLIRQGATTLNARTAYERTETMPNHAGMITGRRVSAPGGHGVSFNADNGGTVHESAGEQVSSMFSVVHDHGGRTAFFSAKEKFAFFNRSWGSSHGGTDRSGVDNGRDKIDEYVLGEEQDLVRRLNRSLTTHPCELSLLHLAGPDANGHKHGFMSRPYLDAVRDTDALLRKVLRTIAGSRKLRRSTVVVLTADHGGTGSAHDNPALVENYKVPFMVWGAGIARGRDLYALNGDRLRPAGRPDYRGVQPVRNAEMANLVTDLLDLPRVPGSQVNIRRNLDVSE